jgi:glycosyltransferase involved in cell wall biosynthesis
VSKKRVVVVSDTMYPWFIGGKEERLRVLRSNLDAEKFEVIFATMKWWEGPAPKSHYAICKKIDLYHNGRRSIFSSLYFALACFKVLRIKPDLVEADQMPFLQIWPLKLVCLLRRIPLCVTWHEVWGPKYWHEYLGNLGPIAGFIETLTMKLPDRIIAVSEMTRQRLIDHGVDTAKIALVANTVDAFEIRNAKTNLPATDLLYVGRLLQHKRVDLLLDSLSQLKSQGSLYTLSVVGQGPLLHALIDQATRLGVSSQVTFYSKQLRSEDIWGLMGTCKVFVSPSEREGFGIAALEAITAGTRVLVSSHSDNASRFLVTSTEVGEAVSKQSISEWSLAISNALIQQVKDKEHLSNTSDSQVDFSILYQENWEDLLVRN